MGTPLPTGPAFRINSESSFSSTRSVATLKDGTFVVIWTDEVEVGGQEVTTVKGQVFHANGTKLGQEMVVSSRKGIHRDVTVAALKDGGFVVSYSHSPDGSSASEDIWLRIYKADRTAGNESIATANTAGWQGRPVVTALDKGGFALSYNTKDGTTSPLVTQYFDAKGGRLGVRSKEVVHPV